MLVINIMLYFYLSFFFFFLSAEVASPFFYFIAFISFSRKMPCMPKIRKTLNHKSWVRLTWGLLVYKLNFIILCFLYWKHEVHVRIPWIIYILNKVNIYVLSFSYFILLFIIKYFKSRFSLKYYHLSSHKICLWDQRKFQVK